MDTLGVHLRHLRESKGLLLREVGHSIGLDTALISKFERDQRRPTKHQLISLSQCYETNPESLLVLWLSEKITDEIIGEKLALEAIQLATQRIKIIHKENNINP